MLERRMRVIRDIYSKKRGTLNAKAGKLTYSDAAAKRDRKNKLIAKK